MTNLVGEQGVDGRRMRDVHAFHEYVTQAYGPATLTLCPPGAVGLTEAEVAGRQVCILTGTWVPHGRIVLLLGAHLSALDLATALEGGGDPLAAKARRYLALKDNPNLDPPRKGVVGGLNRAARRALKRRET